MRKRYMSVGYNKIESYYLNELQWFAIKLWSGMIIGLFVLCIGVKGCISYDINIHLIRWTAEGYPRDLQNGSIPGRCPF